MIFSCQINKRGRLAPASALRSSTSAATAAAALRRPGWKAPARPGPRTSQLPGRGATKPPARPPGAPFTPAPRTPPQKLGDLLSQPTRETRPKCAELGRICGSPRHIPRRAQRCGEMGSGGGGGERIKRGRLGSQKRSPGPGAVRGGKDTEGLGKAHPRVSSVLYCTGRE